MRKFFQLTVLCVVTVLLLGGSKIIHKGILLKNFPENSLLRTSAAIAEEHVLNEMIFLPDGDFSEREAASIIASLSHVPYNQLKALYDKGVSIKLFTGKLTDDPLARHLKGVVPKGYQNGRTWDDVPGMGGEKTVFVKIGHSKQGMGHGSINLELHELAHLIDRLVYNYLRNSADFLKLWKREKKALFPNSEYMQTYPEEYFAEAYAMFYYDHISRLKLKKKAPETYQFIKTLP